MIDHRLPVWIEAHLDGTLAGAELAACRTALAADPALREGFRHHCQMAAQLANELGPRDQSKSAELARRIDGLLADSRRVRSQARRVLAGLPRWPARVIWALAALLVLAIGLPVTVMALRASSTGAAIAWREDAGGRSVLVAGAQVTGTVGMAIVQADGSRLGLGRGAKVLVGDRPGRYQLDHGLIEARIAPQSPAGFSISTPSGRVSVVGTTFTLLATPVASWLAVSEGSVDLASAAGTRRITAGGRALMPSVGAPRLLPAVDRRPIGSWVLCQGSTVMNPRGWFGDERADYRGAAGATRFATALVAAADAGIEDLRAHGAQGVILWDLEGNHEQIQRYPGDPRLIGDIAPEMDSAADGLFTRLASAGFATGVRIGVHPFRRVGDRLVVDPDDDRMLDEATARIAFARTRWGCTLFFLGHNLTRAGLDQMAAGGAIDPEHHATPTAVILALQARFPGCTFIPEYAADETWALTPCFAMPSPAGLARAAELIRRWPWATPAVFQPAGTVPAGAIELFAVTNR
ncbi:hypothetical protein LBMAG53_26610 [Planctomycetota bacterium]|nr:hypothetical protein LBMAG53_26610 [Planctomycetota bacterium]